MALLSATLIAILIGSLFLFAESSDVDARKREEIVVENGLKSRMLEIGSLVVPNAVWDEAVRNLDNVFDPAWAHDNIGQFFYSTGGFSFAFVLDAQDRPIYGMRDAADVGMSSYDPIRSAAAMQVDQARKEEDRRRTLQVDALDSPDQFGSMELIGGRLFIVTATLVQSDFGTAKIEGKRAPVIVTGREIDGFFLAEFATRYLLDDLHLNLDLAHKADRKAQAAIRDDRGSQIAALDWLPQTPGTALLRQVLPWIVLALVGMLVTALALYLRTLAVSKRLVASEQLAVHMAYNDRLTGIPNRAAFERTLADVTKRNTDLSETFALLCIDLDRFKELNDIYGHQVGDELLQQVANRLMVLTGGSEICARLGGDEFVVIQSGVTKAAASELADRIVAGISATYDLSIGAKRIGCSIGIALSGVLSSEPLELLRQADLALYKAKDMGRNHARFFEEEMDADLKVRRLLQDDLRGAIADGEIRMVYQPQVDSRGTIVGVEALARWAHPAMGAISPTLFVELAEQGGMIAQLGEFTLRCAAADSLRWPGIKVAVNVSATQIQMADFARRAVEIVKEAGADPKSIEIELTEGVLLAEDAQTLTTLNALSEAGFSIALDDFGTGYSSLSYLRKFPISKIKIDRSFVSAMGANHEGDAIVNAIVRLAQALELSVIAEGVETIEQWLRLSAIGCGKIQGYVASKPVEPSLISGLVATGLRPSEPANDQPASNTPRDEALVA